jgi:hypothetical protein
MIDLQQIIDDAITSTNQVSGRTKQNPKFYVSDAGTCYRKRYFKRLGLEGDVKIEMPALRKMAAGEGSHIHLSKLLTDTRKLFGNEGIVENEHIRGRYDGIIKDEDHQKLVVDFKTVEKWGMSHIKGSCKCADKNEPGHVGPKKEHELQLFTYWSFLRKDFTNLDQAVLLYVKREDFGSAQFNYLWSEDIQKEVAAEWLPLIDYWEKEEVPPCTCVDDYGGNGIKYCRYANADKTECCSLNLLKQEITI